MEKSQRYRLKWEQHQLSAFDVFNTLMENGKLVDITLSAEGKHLRAHRLVLCACSGYFENLLSGDYDKHPIFFLKDVKFQELEAIMEFMYKGEVKISQDKLNDFIQLAEALKIKGLTVNNPAESVPATPNQLTNTKRHSDDEDGSVTKTPGSQKKKKLNPNDDAPTRSLLQTLPSTSATTKMTPDKPNTSTIQSRVLLQPIPDNRSQPTINNDNSMDMQNNDKARPNLRSTATSQEIPASNQARDEVLLSDQQVLQPCKGSRNMKIFVGKRSYTIKRSNHQFFM